MRKRKLGRILKRNAVLKAIVAHQHHGAGHEHGEDGADQRIQPCPLQVGETQPLLRHATLLEEELPRRNGRAHNRDHQKDQAAGDAARRHGRKCRVARNLSPIGMNDIRQHEPGQVQQAKHNDDALPAQIAPGDHHQRQPQRRDRH